MQLQRICHGTLDFIQAPGFLVRLRFASWRSCTRAVMLFNASRGLSPFLVGHVGGLNMETRIKSFTVGVPVTDLNSAVEWYRRLLGDVEEINPAPGVWEFQIISSGWLQLFECEPNGSNPAVVRFESDDLEASRTLALSLGTDVSEIETVPEAVRHFEFRDPFGNQLSFYELLS